jgi:mannitol/fructose-specific phosphotransferase system IIA component (Ntr-type)
MAVEHGGEALRRKNPMKLREIVVDKAIVPNLVATKLEDAIHELLNALVESGRVSPDMRETFAKSILAREKKGSTGLNHGVAIPHTKTTAVKSPLAAVGISRTGVDFNALDKQPVYSIFLMLSPEENPTLHVDAMKAIFTQLSKDQFRRFLRQATTVEAVTRLLDEADSGQVGRGIRNAILLHSPRALLRRQPSGGRAVRQDRNLVP